MKASLILIAALLLGLLSSACTDEEVALFHSLPPAQQQAVLAAHQPPAINDVSLHPVLVCIRRHESDRGPYPHKNGYKAQNPRSTASGAYQFLDGTWRAMSAKAGYGGYSRAMYAPPSVQDAVAFYTAVTTGGKSHWRGSGC